MKGRTVRTPKRAVAFCEQLRLSGGNVTRACEAVGIGRRSVYEWRDDDAEFAAAWNEALEAGTEELEEEARRRALRGTEEPVFYKGEPCGAIRKYSDTLAIFLLKANKPEKYRENINISIPNLDAAIERQLERLAAGSQAATVGEVEGESVH